MIIAIALTLVVELLIFAGPVWRARRGLAFVLVPILSGLTAALVVSRPDVLTFLVAYVSLARVFNLLRLIESRIKEQHLRRSALRASKYLAIVQALLLIALQWEQTTMTTRQILPVLAVLQFLAALVLVVSTLRTLKKSQHVHNQQNYSDKEFPTVTVAIPARNETEDLEHCLDSLIASDYPKLEIVVLDDCSRDRTPEIIKQYAHDGVRFISGSEPDDSWLPKNAAYQRLLQESSGELIMFCGVDTRFHSTTVRAMVTTLLNRQKKMISILPRRLTQPAAATLIQPLRYWWELALPRRLFNRPPVLSTCWLIERKILNAMGGFASWKRTIIPEALIARELTKHDAYSFIRADEELSVETRKSWQEQRDTAIRTRYPQLHRRPELAFGLIFVELVLLAGPLITLIAAIWMGMTLAAILAGVACMLLVINHLVIIGATNPPGLPFALINFPLVVLSELSLGTISMLKYEFSTVDWKGRNICIPVMRVIPRLPPLDDQNR